MTRCDPDMLEEDAAERGQLVCLDCGRSFALTLDYEAHLQVDRPDAPYRPYDVPLWEA